MEIFDVRCYATYPCMPTAQRHQRKLWQMSFHSRLSTRHQRHTTTKPIGNNFSNIELVGPNWRLPACLPPVPGGKTFPGGHQKEERKRRRRGRRLTDSVSQSLLIHSSCTMDFRSVAECNRAGCGLFTTPGTRLVQPQLSAPIAPFKCYATNPFFQPTASPAYYPHESCAVLEPIFYSGERILRPLNLIRLAWYETASRTL